jgi:hypothetical protein
LVFSGKATNHGEVLHFPIKMKGAALVISRWGWVEESQRNWSKKLRINSFIKIRNCFEGLFGVAAHL